MSYKAARSLMASTLEREDSRYERELEGMTMPVAQGAVQHAMAAVYGNLVAAEEALKALFIRVEGLQARSGL